MDDNQVFSENITFRVRTLAASPYAKQEGVWGIRIYFQPFFTSALDGCLLQTPAALLLGQRPPMSIRQGNV